MTPNVLNFFSAAASSGAATPQQSGPKPGGGVQTSGTPQAPGMSLSAIEANMKKQVSSPTPRNDFSIVRVPLRVFTPFSGATPLCGLELRIDSLGYRVVRVTEKPGQDGNIREGDIITAIDNETLIPKSIASASSDDKERHIRSTSSASWLSQRRSTTQLCPLTRTLHILDFRILTWCQIVVVGPHCKANGCQAPGW
jgi:hypothetical protein